MNKIWNWYIGLFKPQATPALTIVKRLWGAVVIPLLLFATIVAVIDKESPESKKKASIENTEWGVEDTMRQMILKQLKDPNSYERVSFQMTHNDNGGDVCVLKYRSKNGFGGYNFGQAMATYDKATNNVTMVQYE